MSKINWNGSQSAWRAKTAQPGRDLRAQPSGNRLGLQGASYLTLAGAFAGVAAGSVGATVLAMSLMSADVPELASEVAEVAISEARVVEPAEAAVQPEPKTASSAETPAAIAADLTQPAAAETQNAATEQETAQAAQEAEVEALKSSDPRWAQFSKPAPPLDELRNDAQEGEASAFGSAGQTGGALAAVQRAIEQPEEDQGQDAQETAAIARPPRGEEPKADAGGGRQTVLNTAANVRSRANKSGKVLGAIPAGVKVSSFGCRSSWCEVSYKGLRGWVYSGFVSGNAKQQGASRQKATAASGQRQKLQVQPTASKASTSLPGVKTNEPLPTVPRPDKSGK